jgi:hypothetical protein
MLARACGDGETEGLGHGRVARHPQMTASPKQIAARLMASSPSPVTGASIPFFLIGRGPIRLCAILGQKPAWPIAAGPIYNGAS